MELPQKLDVLSRVSWLPGTFASAQLVVAAVMGVAAFAQALTGFGFAVVSVGALSSMPWLLHSELYEVITPVAATLGGLVGSILLLPSLRSLAWAEILPLLVSCTLLTPVGVGLSTTVDPLVATRTLAVLILGFVAYEASTLLLPMHGSKGKLPDCPTDSLTDGATGKAAGENMHASSDGCRRAGARHMPLASVSPPAILAHTTPVQHIEPEAKQDARRDPLTSPAAVVVLGALAGLFGGAFDVQGPPLVVYGTAKGWAPRRFRDNVLTVVAINSLCVVLAQSLSGASTTSNFYYAYFCLTSLPAVLAGVAAGQYVSERIDSYAFTCVVLAMCLGLGMQLLFVR